MKKLLLLVLIAVPVIGGAFLALTHDWQAPAVSLPDRQYVNRDVTATLTDNRGLGEVCYYLDGRQDAKQCVNAGGATRFELAMDLTPFADGKHQVCVDAADANGFLPNSVSACREYTLDKIAPKGAIENVTRYMERGGSAAVAVSTAEPEQDIRVVVGGYSFPFISNDAGTRHFAVFAHPQEMELAAFKPVVEIRDQAGNLRRLPISVVSKDRVFKSDQLNIPHSFIESKSLEMLNREGSGKEAFLEMNQKVREESRARLKEVIAAVPGATPMWASAFYRNLGAPKAGYADRRTYLLDGEAIDHQTHLGLDIAGLAAMPIKSAEKGVVVFADYVGIYGNCILVDHGAHVSTLYAHLSQIDVSPGTAVTREQVIARSGLTGMAGGDHLHYAVFVGEVPVEPTEWFDPNWVKTRINEIYASFRGY